MDFSVRTAALVSCALLVSAHVAPLARADDAGPRPALDSAAVGVLVERYSKARTWGVKSLVLVALGPRWHPDGAEIVLDSLIGADARLRAYGLEALRACDRGWLKPVARRPIVEELIRLLEAKDPLVRRRAHLILRRIAPFVDGESAETLQAWWRRVSATYRPPPPPAEVRASGSVEVAYRKARLERVAQTVALNASGLDLVIVLDSSASMTRTIAHARRALRELMRFLRGLVPGLRLGLVHFKDADTLRGSAQRLVALTDDVRRVEAALVGLDTRGGGDRLEAVDVGIQVAIDAETGWRRDAVKAIVVIGDAPPRAETHEAMWNLLRQARVGTADRGRWTVSAIDVGRARDTELVFKRIAELGGGVYHRLEVKGEASALNSPLLELLIRTALSSAGEEASKRLLTIYREYRPGFGR